MTLEEKIERWKSADNLKEDYDVIGIIRELIAEVERLRGMIDDGWNRSMAKAINHTNEALQRAEKAESRIRELEEGIRKHAGDLYNREPPGIYDIELYKLIGL